MDSAFPTEPVAAQAQDVISDALFRPMWIESRQAYICVRYLRGTRDGKPYLEQETWGARMSGPQGTRFSPEYVFEEARAAKLCAELNKRG